MKVVPFWRVCRVLANRQRLKMFALISRRPGMRVGDLARAMKLSGPATSQYLRALEACGFVVGRRIRKFVTYELAGRDGNPATKALVRSLILRLADKGSIEPVFKLATAFANPARIEVFRKLTTGPKTLPELKSLTGFPRSTLSRHIQKLRNRGFVNRQAEGKAYEYATPADHFGRALAHATKHHSHSP